MFYNPFSVKEIFPKNGVGWHLRNDFNTFFEKKSFAITDDFYDMITHFYQCAKSTYEDTDERNLKKITIRSIPEINHYYSNYKDL